MLNEILIQGRFTATPELKTTPSGTYVTSFTLAVERDFKAKETGEKGVDFINCVAWRGDAEFVTRYFTKGRMATVVGRLLINNYTDKDGIKRRDPEVEVKQIYFGDSNNGGTGNNGAGQSATNAQPAPSFEPLSDGEDLPF